MVGCEAVWAWGCDHGDTWRGPTQEGSPKMQAKGLGAVVPSPEPSRALEPAARLAVPTGLSLLTVPALGKPPILSFAFVTSLEIWG